MTPTSKITARSVLATLAATCLMSIVGAHASGQPKPLQIGMAKSFVHEKASSVIEIAADDFKAILKTTTGFDGQLVTKFDAAEVAQKVNGKQLDFGILHAREFAWAQKKYPELRPLLIAAGKHPAERAHLMVAKNSPIKTIAELRGKKFDLPVGTKDDCRAFLEKHCTDKDRKGLPAFFGSIAKSATQKEALDNVARGKADATIIDTTALEFQKEVRGPFIAQNLRVLQESEGFPPAVVVYKPGALEQKTLDQFRDGLRKAHTIPDGRDLMKTWGIDAFELIPKDYQARLDAVLKAYPPPDSLR